METSNYRITPVRKKRTKITLSAALVLCLLFFIVGILGGRAFSSNKQAKEATKQMQKMEQEFTIEKTRAEAEIKTYESEINRLKGELAEAKQLADDIIKAKEKEEEESEQATESSEDSEAASEESAAVEESLPEETKSSGGNFTRNLLIVIFVIVIIVCVLFLFSMYFRKNDEDEDEDEEYEDDAYELEPTDYDDDFEDDFESNTSQDDTEE